MTEPSEDGGERVDWRLLELITGDGAAQMALDEALLLSVGAGEAPPTLRFYRWSPPAVSIGYAQRLAEVVDVEECRHRGVDVARRPTGGRAVLHGWDLTYCVAVPEGYFEQAAGVIATAGRIAEALAEGLRDLGLDAVVERPRSGEEGHHRGPCFLSLSRHELQVGGRKVAGSAQRRMAGAILQHGSIALEEPPFSPADLVPGGPALRRALAADLRTRSTTISAALGRCPSLEELRAALVEGFRAMLGDLPRLGPLSPREEEQARALREKHASPSWVGWR